MNNARLTPEVPTCPLAPGWCDMADPMAADLQALIPSQILTAGRDPEQLAVVTFLARGYDVAQADLTDASHNRGVIHRPLSRGLESLRHNDFSRSLAVEIGDPGTAGTVRGLAGCEESTVPSVSVSTCHLDWCSKRVSRNGLCAAHARHVERFGRLPLPVYRDERARLYARIEIAADGCWNWTGALKENGYGVVRFRGRTRVAHRAMWLLERGEVADGLDLDHLCHNRRCVNPEHLEPVTRAENLRRGDGIRATDTHCARGHEWPGGRQRHCVTCQRDDNRANQRRRRERGCTSA